MDWSHRSLGGYGRDRGHGGHHGQYGPSVHGGLWGHGEQSRHSGHGGRGGHLSPGSRRFTDSEYSDEEEDDSDDDYGDDEEDEDDESDFGGRRDRDRRQERGRGRRPQWGTRGDLRRTQSEGSYSEFAGSDYSTGPLHRHTTDRGPQPSGRRDGHGGTLGDYDYPQLRHRGDDYTDEDYLEDLDGPSAMSQDEMDRGVYDYAEGRRRAEQWGRGPPRGPPGGGPRRQGGRSNMFGNGSVEFF